MKVCTNLDYQEISRRSVASVPSNDLNRSVVGVKASSSSSNGILRHSEQVGVEDEDRNSVSGLA